MKSLKELKDYFQNKYLKEPSTDAVIKTAPVNEKFDFFEFQKFLIDNSDMVDKFADEIGKGEDFRIYFSDESFLEEFRAMRKSDPESFYRILRKEELFLNTCLRMYGYNNVLLTLDPDSLENFFPNTDDFV